MIRNRYNQVKHLTHDTIWESAKSTRKRQTQDRLEASPFPDCDHKAAMKRKYSIIKTKLKYK